MSPKTGKVALISAFLVLSFLLSAAISLSCGAGGIDFAGMWAAVSGGADESARPLNLMLLGRQQAFHSGVNVGLVWVLVGSAAALATSASVAICGIIGFVGLVVPHMVRTVSGPDNRVLLPLSAVGGATILALADAAARLWSPSDPVPIGVVTALLGAPFFLALLKRAGDSADD